MIMFIFGLVVGCVLSGVTACAVVTTTLRGIDAQPWEDE
jgi:hypothetical protein